MMLLLLLSTLAPAVATLGGEPPLWTALPAVAVLLTATVDRLWGCKPRLQPTRKVEPVLSLGVSTQVRLEVRNTSGRPVAFDIADTPPSGSRFEPADAVLSAVAQAHKICELQYSLTAQRRGHHEFGDLEIGHPSLLGLWYVRHRTALRDEVQVFPNIEALRRFELLARVNNLADLGVRSVRMKGEGTEFERLRDYRPGDEPRKVDWKATRRFDKLIVREMGQERNQNILLLIDMGRMMRQVSFGLTHFDYALDAAIILAHIAQGRGDNVGAVFFSDSIKRYVPLCRGRRAVDAIVHAGYDLEPEQTATSYSRMFRHVSAHVNKRALLLLMTHLVPGEDSRLVRSYMTVLSQRHLPLCLFFSEPEIDEALAGVPASTEQAFARAAAADLLLERREGLAALRQAGVLATDSIPGQMSAVAIGSYLDIKARNLL
jgi:uncharacterized protein (DUF58 family)